MDDLNGMAFIVFALPLSVPCRLAHSSINVGLHICNSIRNDVDDYFTATKSGAVDGSIEPQEYESNNNTLKIKVPLR